MPPDNFKITDLILAQYRVPAINGYNRLEAAPRTVDFDRSLRAEIRDPLWMLTRQWQFGEFQGEDAGSAATAKISGHHVTMDKLQLPGNVSVPYDGIIPLETLVEAEPLRAELFLAVQMGRYFARLIRTRTDYTSQLNTLLGSYPLNYQPLENDQEGQQLLIVANGKVFDGWKFQDDIAGDRLVPGLKTSLASEIVLFQNWYRRIFSQPAAGSNPLWQPAQLDYEFSLASSQNAGQNTMLTASHYDGGHLDWYCFDSNTITTQIPGTVPVVPVSNNISSYIPSPVSFRGMPNPRFWMMEDSRTDFGKIDTSPTGLLHLLLAEFGLLFSNDWFLLPYQLPVNSLCEIKGIMINDVFGVNVLIQPAGTGTESQWQRWALFHHTEQNPKATTASRFYLAPAVITSLEGEPIEEVKFLRDTMANMVWAVESVVPSQAGKGVSGDEMARKDYNSNAGIPTGSTTATIGYVLGTTVPDNWIPFIPVKIAGTLAEIQLQRAKLPGAIGALGTLLTEKAAPYYINEETVQRSGAVVSFSFQNASAPDGQRHLWLGRKKQNGSGEGWSNLAFDQIKQLP